MKDRGKEGRDMEREEHKSMMRDGGKEGQKDDENYKILKFLVFQFVLNFDPVKNN